MQWRTVVFSRNKKNIVPSSQEGLQTWFRNRGQWEKSINFSLFFIFYYLIINKRHSWWTKFKELTMAHEILTAWFPLHTLNHKKRQRIKQKVFHHTKLEVFLQVLILHGLNSSCDQCIRSQLSFVEISCCCTGVFLYSVTHAYLSLRGEGQMFI